MLEKKINEEFLISYKNKNELEVNVLRMIKTVILNKKIEKKLPKEEVLSDEEIIAVLKSELKKRTDSFSAYTAGNRNDLAEVEKNEMAIISRFLPEQLTDEQVRQVVNTVIAEIGNPGASGFGKLMAEVMKRTKGSADGNQVSKIVKEQLSK
jgi:uncharacterized protein